MPQSHQPCVPADAGALRVKEFPSAMPIKRPDCSSYSPPDDQINLKLILIKLFKFQDKVRYYVLYLKAGISHFYLLLLQC